MGALDWAILGAAAIAAGVIIRKVVRPGAPAPSEPPEEECHPDLNCYDPPKGWTPGENTIPGTKGLGGSGSSGPAPSSGTGGSDLGSAEGGSDTASDGGLWGPAIGNYETSRPQTGYVDDFELGPKPGFNLR